MGCVQESHWPMWNTSNLHKHIKAVHLRENSRAAKAVEKGGGRQTRSPRSLADALQPEIRNIQVVHMRIRSGEGTNNYTEIQKQDRLTLLQLRVRQLVDQL